MTTRHLLTAALAILGSITNLLAADPVVSNLTAAQRPGTKFVDITYDVTADTQTVKVTLEISSDGGTTYSVPLTSATGAVGNGVTVGTGKTITWNAGVDWDGKFTPLTRFRVMADDFVPAGFSLIPAGGFTMGQASSDTDIWPMSDAPPVAVNVSAFYMAKYEVTKAVWDEVRSWASVNGYSDLALGGGKAANHPVHSITWFDIVKWCNAMSQKEGLTPVYTVAGEVIKTGTTVPLANWSANGYRLPTEAEWEKAARGGKSGKLFPWGADTISHSQANYYASRDYIYDISGFVNYYHPIYNIGSTPYTSPVGSFGANGYGLYDIAGNVFEWCWDWYESSTYVNGATNPQGAASGSARVLRSGTWDGAAPSCRVAHRNQVDPSGLDNDIGFRLARSSAP